MLAATVLAANQKFVSVVQIANVAQKQSVMANVVMLALAQKTAVVVTNNLKFL